MRVKNPTGNGLVAELYLLLSQASRCDDTPSNSLPKALHFGPFIRNSLKCSESHALGGREGVDKRQQFPQNGT